MHRLLPLILPMLLWGCSPREVGEGVYRALEQKSCHEQTGAYQGCGKTGENSLRRE